jgi:hypothetical protein
MRLGRCCSSHCRLATSGAQLKRDLLRRAAANVGVEIPAKRGIFD